jgi:hypothetical protein
MIDTYDLTSQQVTGTVSYGKFDSMSVYLTQQQADGSVAVAYGLSKPTTKEIKDTKTGKPTGLWTWTMTLSTDGAAFVEGKPAVGVVLAKRGKNVIPWSQDTGKRGIPKPVSVVA